MSAMIPLSGTEKVPFVPKFFEMQEDLADKPTFFLRVPTFAMRDKMAAMLFQRGLIPPTVPVGRGLLIDALFDLFPEAEAEDHASFLESYWTRDEVHTELIQGWQIREATRLFDVTQGVRKKLPAEPIPVAPFTMREQARQARIVTDVLERSDRYRSYQARFMVAQEEEEEMLLRLFVERWINCGAAEPERDDMDRLTLGCIEKVRHWLDGKGAKTAWDEVKLALRHQFGAPRGLEKNFDSPLDTNSSQTGSQTSSGDTATNDGSSTTSSITPTPALDLPATLGASRNSRSGKKGTRQRGSAARKKTGRTVARS